MQHEKSATWKEKRVQHECNMKKMQHGKSATLKKCNMEKAQHGKVQHAKSATLKTWNMQKVQHGKSTT